MNAPTMFQAAQRAGRTVRQLYDEEGKALEASDVKFDVSFLLGSQIRASALACSCSTPPATSSSARPTRPIFR